MGPNMKPEGGGWMVIVTPLELQGDTVEYVADSRFAPAGNESVPDARDFWGSWKGRGSSHEPDLLIDSAPPSTPKACRI